MRSRKTAAIILIFVFTMVSVALMGRSNVDMEKTKKLDLEDRIHKVGNIWLRVSNYGFFGSGDDVTPQWPSLEYPGGSGIDYLYQGALWFGAKKIRRNQENKILYWVHNPPEDESDYCTEDDPEWTSEMNPVVDTLVTVGFDGDDDLMEFLPAFNPSEDNALGTTFSEFNLFDTVMTASIWNHRAGVDDDGDGRIDEDPVGFGFPMRSADELPDVVAQIGGEYLKDADAQYILDAVDDELWFPLGFVDLSEARNQNSISFCFSKENDDDIDGLDDEDGYPMSEQDYIAYYYDYSPFKTGVERKFGSRKSSYDHYPIGVMIRQMSYQWSYDYIKNLVYIEFDITNMNANDILYDCAMGIYMDSDVGPQSWGADERSMDDVSSYVPGPGYEFAYTYDADQDQGLTTGYVGSRVCTPIPDPDSLNYSCWYWNRGDGPDDTHPRDLTPSGSPTSNEKYWLLTGLNPDPSKYISLRDFPESQMSDPDDTRYLFAFSGDGQGFEDEESETSWNLRPYKTMKIVIAVFPGESVEELKQTAEWAKEIYGDAQSLTTAVLPDTFPHYNPPEPPEIPSMYAEMTDSGDKVNIFWDNRSEFTYDEKAVSKGKIGYQSTKPELPSYDPNAESLPEYNPESIVDPITAKRLRHDFQGYSVWTRSGRGSQEYWMLHHKWDKIDTDQDHLDYNCTIDLPSANYWNFGGELGKDVGLPYNGEMSGQPAPVVTAENYEENSKYYRLNDQYELVPFEIGDYLYGLPIYDANIVRKTLVDSMLSDIDNLNVNPKYNPSYSIFENEQLIFRNPDMSANIYLKLVDDRLITIDGHLGQFYQDEPDFTEKAIDRLARKYYTYTVSTPQKGVELYVSVTAFDRGMPSNELLALESSKDANMQVFFPGPRGRSNMDNIYVAPNPYLGLSNYDGRRENDPKGDKSRRIWFVNIPERCTIRIFTLAGDLVDTIEHNGQYLEDVISTSKAATAGVAASGIHAWDLLSKNDQIVVSGVYLFSVEDKASGDLKVGKFVIIR